MLVDMPAEHTKRMLVMMDPFCEGRICPLGFDLTHQVFDTEKNNRC